MWSTHLEARVTKCGLTYDSRSYERARVYSQDLKRVIGSVDKDLPCENLVNKGRVRDRSTLWWHLIRLSSGEVGLVRCADRAW